jgi:predicted phage terminase large subunit-like protein
MGSDGSGVTPTGFSAILRSYFFAFFLRCYQELHGGELPLINWHLELMAERLVAVRDGKTKRLIINIPPRYGKSLVVSVAFVAWCLGHNPAMRFICVSYAQDLSEKHHQDVITIMRSDFFRAAFPGAALKKVTAHELTTIGGGGRLATSIGGSITGFGADVLIVDDPVKPDEAMSDVRRQTANDWLPQTGITRLNDKKNGKIIVVMQRLHEDDFTGSLLQQGGWDLLRLRAIAEEEETYTIHLPNGGVRTVRRAIGEPLHPEREAIPELQATEKSMGSFGCSGQYQQSPMPRDGGLVKTVWIKSFDLNTPPQFDRVIQSIDSASKATEFADHSVCLTFGIVGDFFYLLHAYREKVGFPELRRQMMALRQRFQPDAVIVEDKASGIQLIQELREENFPVIAFKPEGDKVMRLVGHSAHIEGGGLFVPEDAPWRDAFIHELAVFPRGRYDDQVDALSQAMTWHRRRFPGWGILEHYRREAAAQIREDELYWVRPTHAVNATHVITISGRTIGVHEDAVQVTGEELPGMLASGYERVPRDFSSQSNSIGAA